LIHLSLIHRHPLHNITLEQEHLLLWTIGILKPRDGELFPRYPDEDQDYARGSGDDDAVFAGPEENFVGWDCRFDGETETLIVAELDAVEAMPGGFVGGETRTQTLELGS